MNDKEKTILKRLIEAAEPFGSDQNQNGGNLVMEVSGTEPYMDELQEAINEAKEVL